MAEKTGQDERSTQQHKQWRELVHRDEGAAVVQTVYTVGVGPSTFLLREYGMHCLKTLFLSRHYQHSGVDLKPSFFPAVKS